jgi:Spy/CpxP family protein refolding chaperone
MTEVRMYKVFIVLTLSIFIPFISFAQSGHSPYVGQEKREIKALSSEDIEGLLEGHGMGLAKAAELNHYPGPKHVLELVKEMHLSKEQVDKTKEIYDTMHEEAVRLGRKIIEKEKSLDTLFANQKIDQKNLADMTLEIGNLQGELRAAHLKAHLEMKKILSSQQIDRYDTLRGYQGNSGKQKHHHKNHSSHH